MTATGRAAASTSSRRFGGTMRKISRLMFCAACYVDPKDIQELMVSILFCHFFCSSILFVLVLLFVFLRLNLYLQKSIESYLDEKIEKGMWQNKEKDIKKFVKYFRETLVGGLVEAQSLTNQPLHTMRKKTNLIFNFQGEPLIEKFIF